MVEASHERAGRNSGKIPTGEKRLAVRIDGQSGPASRRRTTRGQPLPGCDYFLRRDTNTDNPNRDYLLSPCRSIWMRIVTIGIGSLCLDSARFPCSLPTQGFALLPNSRSPLPVAPAPGLSTRRWMADLHSGLHGPRAATTATVAQLAMVEAEVCRDRVGMWNKDQLVYVYWNVTPLAAPIRLRAVLFHSQFCGHR